uniref:Aminopeptidase n=1 Tax=Anopheles farauti TaxID=69004 RepID=A0A182QUN7_9DIPT
MVWILACSVLWSVLLGPGVLADDRLPNATIPLHYDLRLEATGLGRNDFTYRGVVSIRISIARDTDEVVLHSVGSALRSTALRRCRDQAKIGHRVLKAAPDSELLHIRTDRTLRTLDDAVIVLTIVFNNTLGKEQKGFYRTQYLGPRRAPMVVATTHFQPCYARLAFPCFDEPALKTTFQVTIVSNASYTVASNAPIANVTWLPDGHKVVLFERTVPMQTYLVTFLIANFTSVHARSPSGVEVGVLAPPKDKDWLQFSLQAATVLLTGLERYTGQGLGVAKLAHAVIPRFGNAMENWGLVSYDEQYLVLRKRAHRLQRAQAVITIGHETAHQLFGNVVGPAWWSYLWLSEGFATYLEVVLGSESYPELVPLEETFAVRHMRRALLEDAVGDRALTVEPLPADTNQIETLFDTITYSKAACILRMINCSIGEAHFRSGVRRYLTNHWNGVVTPADLYACFSTEREPLMSEEPTVEQMFRSWSDKPGYPVVTVERLNASYVRFRQERYQQEVTAPDTHSRWHIPITYFSNSSQGKYEYRPAFWMRESDRVVVAALELDWEDVLIVNPRQVGFYRVEYDARGWERIVDVLTLLPPVVQAKLLDDAFVFARAGMLGYETSLALLGELLENPHPVPWLIAMAEENIGFLQRVLQSDEFNRLVAGFAGEMFRFTGNVAQTLLQSQTLDQALGWLGRLGVTDSVGKSRSVRDTRSKACGVPSVDEMVQSLVALDIPPLERKRLFALLECPSNPALTIRVLVAALERMQATNLLTPAKQYALLERLIKSDPARLLMPVVHFLSGDGTGYPYGEEVISPSRPLQRLLTLMIHEVSDRGQAEAVRKLITEYSTSLSEDFLRRANITLTSTISWHTEQVPKIRALLLNDSRLGARYGQTDAL